MTADPSWSAVQSHVEPDTGVAQGSPDLDQVAELVYRPQPQASGAAGRGWMTACQRVGDVAGVADLADQIPAGTQTESTPPPPVWR